MSGSFHEVIATAARTHSMSCGTCTLNPPQSLVTPACDQGKRVRTWVEASVDVIRNYSCKLFLTFQKLNHRVSSLVYL